MHDPVPPSGLAYGLVLNGRGGSRPIIQADLPTLQLAAGETLWLHWDRSAPDAHAWLRQASELNEFTCDVLLEEATRPRRLHQPDGSLLLFLRGVNLNPGADPEDMVSLRIHASARRVISLRLRPLKSVHSLAQALRRGEGPCDAAELVLFLAQALTDGISNVVEELVDALDELEELQETNEHHRPDRQQLLGLRRRSAGLRRYMAPQREIFQQMTLSPPPWRLAGEVDYWSELHNGLTRNLEELDLARERVSLLQDIEQRHLSERMNHTMYLLAVITGFFMPLTFITGLLGMNVGGIPVSDQPLGFALVCGLLGLLALGLWWLLRRLRWL